MPRPRPLSCYGWPSLYTLFLGEQQANRTSLLDIDMFRIWQVKGHQPDQNVRSIVFAVLGTYLYSTSSSASVAHNRMHRALKSAKNLV